MHIVRDLELGNDAMCKYGYIIECLHLKAVGGKMFTRCRFSNECGMYANVSDIVVDMPLEVHKARTHYRLLF